MVLALGSIVCVVALAIAVVWTRALAPLPTADPAAVNALATRIAQLWPDVAPADLAAPPDLAYTVVDANGRIVARGPGPVVTSELQAVRAGAATVTIVVDGARVGQLFVIDPAAAAVDDRSRAIATLASLALIAAALALIALALWLHVRVLRPFGRLRGFAAAVAAGDLDAPLAMDRRQVFGAFTEAFDLLRTELRAARAAEAESPPSVPPPRCSP